MTKKHFFTASAIALSLALSGTAYALDSLDVDVNGNQVSEGAGQSADDSSNISTTGAIAEDSYNGGDTTTKNDNDTYTSTKTDSSQDNDTSTKTDSSQDNDTSTKTDTDTDISKSYNQDNDTKNVKSGNTVASNNGGNTVTKTDSSQDNDTTTKNDNDSYSLTKNDNDTTNTTKNDNDTTTKTDTDTKNVDSFNTKNDNDTSTKNDNDTSTKDSYNQDNDTTTKTDNDTTNTTKDSYNQDNDTTTKTDSSVHTNVVADQDLKGVIVNIGVKEVVDAGSSGVTTGSNTVGGSSFSAYAGVLNAAWNTGVNSNAQAATNIAAYGNVTFGSASSAPAAAAPQP